MYVYLYLVIPLGITGLEKVGVLEYVQKTNTVTDVNVS
jgi:hypothetical protein